MGQMKTRESKLKGKKEKRNRERKTGCAKDQGRRRKREENRGRCEVSLLVVASL